MWKEISFQRGMLRELNQVPTSQRAQKPSTDTCLNTCYEESILYPPQLSGVDHEDEQQKELQAENDDKVIEDNQLMRKIGGEIFFTDRFPVRIDLKAINIVDVDEIDYVLVSAFQDLYGLPYLVQERNCRGFKGKIYMTQALAQIGRALLIEFVKMCEDRNMNAIQYYNNPGSGTFSFFNSKGHSAQGQGGLASQRPHRFNQGASKDWIQQD